MSSQPNASLRVRISADLADIKRDLALLKGALREVKSEGGKPLPRNNAVEQLGLSAKQTQAALRQLPMQFTDIFVGLASGQKPMMVLLQQGGQLKDTFGGVGAALKASIGYVLGLINPVTVGAAAIGAMAVAAYKGSEESTEFAKALASVGDVSGVTTDRLIALSEQMDRGVVTQRMAAGVLVEIARNSSIAGENYRAVAEAAIAMEQLTGQAVEKTVEEFAKLAEKPAEAAAKLNREHHFLTAAVYEQIRALEEQGRVQEAAQLATQAYADAVVKRASDMRSELGLLEKAWANLKLGASSAWDAMLGIGREKSRQERINELYARLQELESNPSGYTGVGPKAPHMRRKAIADLRAQLRALQDEMVAEERAANERALRQQANDAAVAQEDQLRAMATNEQKKVIEIARIKEEARRAIYAAEATGDAELARKLAENRDKLIKAVEAKYAKKTTKANADENSAETLIATIQRQITANQQLTETGEKVSASDRLLIQARQVLADKTNTMTAATRALLESLLPQLEVSDKAAEATQRQAKAAEALARQQGILEQQARNNARERELDIMEIGRGSDVTAQLRRMLAIEREYQDELKRLGDRSVADDQATWDILAENARRHREQQLQEEREYQRQRMDMLSDWRNGARAAWEDYVFQATNAAEQARGALQGAFASAEDAFVRFVQTGKLEFKDLANSIISDLARIQFQRAVVGGLGGWFDGLFGSSAGGAAKSILTKNALGGVYSSPDLSAYSNSIVNRPTFFAFARGAGVMGEAGPEAIMPLRRTADGKLGVEAIGGRAAAPNVQITLKNEGQPIESAQIISQRWDGTNLMIEAVLNAVARDVRRRGVVGEAVEATYGVQGRGVARG